MSQRPRPSLRWRLVYLRLIAATLLHRCTPAGASRVFGVVAIIVAVNLASSYDRAFPAAGNPPQQAILWWVAQLIIFAVSSIISAALAPKPKPPEKVKATAPVVEEGKGIEVVFGTVWIEDPTVLAFKEVGTKKIKAKGGKKG